jgi:flagellar protein FlbD
MIQLTRLNNSKLTINSDLIKFVEQSPDTVITLLNGEKILVQEPANEVVKRVVEFRRLVIAGATAWDGMPTERSSMACSAPLDQRESEG